MARITINEAAKQGFKSRSQINKDVRLGKLPHTVEKWTKVLDVQDTIRDKETEAAKERDRLMTMLEECQKQLADLRDYSPLPAAAIKALSPAEYAATTAAKRRDTKRGKQFSRQPKSIMAKTRRFR